MTERRYQMTRIGKGDWLLPSNDATTIWRLSRYHEDGSLSIVNRDDGTEKVVRGEFWGVFKFVGRSLDTIDLDDYDSWSMYDSLLPTRDAAIRAALGRS